MQANNELSSQLKTIVSDYLQGEITDVVCMRLKIKADERKQSGRALFKSITFNNPENCEILAAILFSLGIKKPAERNDADPYYILCASPNLYIMLKRLYDSRHIYLDNNGVVSKQRYLASRHHVGRLLQLIDNTKPKRSWSFVFLLGALTSAGLGSLFYFVHEYLDDIVDWLTRTCPFVITWIQKTFSLVRNVPIFGIINHSLILLWHWVHTFRNNHTSLLDKFYNILFITLSSSLQICAYIACILAAGVVTVPAICLFIMASTINILESISVLFDTDQLIPPTDQDSWEVAAQYARAKNLRALQQKTFGIKLGAAILATIAVIILYCFPPSLVISMSCMAFSWCIVWGKESQLIAIQESCFNKMQRSIREIRNTRDQRLNPLTDNQHILVNHLLEANTQLNTENERLITENGLRTEQIDRLTAQVTGLAAECAILREENSNLSNIFNQPQTAPVSSWSRFFPIHNAASNDNASTISNTTQIHRP